MVDRRHVLTKPSDSEKKNSERWRLWAHLNDDWIHVFVEFVMRKNPSTSHSIHLMLCVFQRIKWMEKKSTAFESHFTLFREVPHWIGSFISNCFFSRSSKASIHAQKHFILACFSLSLLRVAASYVGINLFLSLMEFYNVLTKSSCGWRRFNVTIFDGTILTIAFNCGCNAI